MTDYLFDPPRIRSLPVIGETAEFPLRRIFCVGRNYEADAAEMGVQVDREAPFYFTKSLESVQESGTTIPYPPGTENFHYEMELVVALDKPVFRVPASEAMDAVFALGCGLDMTRRDVQIRLRNKQRPWDLGKDVEGSAVLTPLTRLSEAGEIPSKRICLMQNGEIRQDAHLSDMIHNVSEIIADLSTYYHLQPGDVILTGTPAGVGPVSPGDTLEGRIDGLQPITLAIGAPE